MLDITTPKFMEILIKDDGKVVWINTEHGCQFRACQIKILVINDNRITKQINNQEKAIRQDKCKTFFGTYPIRSLNGRGEMGIHMPSIFTGEYGIYSEDNGETITLVRMGDRSRKGYDPL